MYLGFSHVISFYFVFFNKQVKIGFFYQSVTDVGYGKKEMSGSTNVYSWDLQTLGVSDYASLTTSNFAIRLQAYSYSKEASQYNVQARVDTVQTVSYNASTGVLTATYKANSWNAYVTTNQNFMYLYIIRD